MIDVLILIGTLAFLGLCHCCASMKKSFWRCPKCGLSKPYRLVDAFQPTGPYVMQRIVVQEQCDRKEDSEMQLITRKWSWWLSRPFAWVWTPFVLLHAAFMDAIKKVPK